MEQTNLINSTFRKKLNTIQNTVSTQLQADNNIAKILCSKASVVIDGYEVLNGEIRFNGNVCFSVTYTNELGEFFVLKNNESFNAKIENENIQLSLIPFFNADVIELKVNATNDEINLTATIETNVSSVMTETVNYIVNMDENIVTNSNFVNYHTLNSNGKLNFNYIESFESKEKINKILSNCASVEILNYMLGTDYFTVEGIITVNFAYEVGDETKEIKNFTKCYKFKEELESEGITKDGELVLTASINNCNITTDIQDKNESSTVEFTLPIDVNFAYLIPNTSEVIVDAYSLKNKLNLNIESFKINDKNLVLCFDEKIDGQMTIDEDAPRIVKILSYCGENVSVTNTFKDNDNVIVEGVASVNVIYLEEDEEEKINSVIIDVPFSVENRFEEVNLSDELITTAIIKDIDVKAKKGKEINLDIELCLKVCAFNTSEEMALTSIVIGEELTPKEACLQIYFARKGNTLWEISKNLMAKPEQILGQNPNINLPLENDEKIVFFKSTELE